MQQNHEPREWHCRIDKTGRIFLPQSLRSLYPVSPGDEFLATIENGTLVLRNYEDAMQRLQDAFAEGIPRTVSLVDELLDERRVEAEREKRS